uniref:Transforming acidic coiled-coil-containing protein C-terminal domain-containing protein n=2 Tax=Clastoptera arizonana TaxID=38151 RepID=A0A1B6E5C2_9HEMI
MDPGQDLVFKRKSPLKVYQSRQPLQDYTNKINYQQSGGGGGAATESSKENANKDLHTSTKIDKSFSDCINSPTNSKSQLESDSDTAEFESISEKDFGCTKLSETQQVTSTNATELTEDFTNAEKTPAKSCIINQENTSLNCVLPNPKSIFNSESTNNLETDNPNNIELCKSYSKSDLSILAEDLDTLNIATPKKSSLKNINVFFKTDNSFSDTSYNDKSAVNNLENQNQEITYTVITCESLEKSETFDKCFTEDKQSLEETDSTQIESEKNLATGNSDDSILALELGNIVLSTPKPNKTGNVEKLFVINNFFNSARITESSSHEKLFLESPVIDKSEIGQSDQNSFTELNTSKKFKSSDSGKKELFDEATEISEVIDISEAKQLPLLSSGTSQFIKDFHSKESNPNLISDSPSVGVDSCHLEQTEVIEQEISIAEPLKESVVCGFGGTQELDHISKLEIFQGPENLDNSLEVKQQLHLSINVNTPLESHPEKETIEEKLPIGESFEASKVCDIGEKQQLDYSPSLDTQSLEKQDICDSIKKEVEQCLEIVDKSFEVKEQLSNSSTVNILPESYPEQKEVVEEKLPGEPFGESEVCVIGEEQKLDHSPSLDTQSLENPDVCDSLKKGVEQCPEIVDKSFEVKEQLGHSSTVNIPPESHSEQKESIAEKLFIGKPFKESDEQLEVVHSPNLDTQSLEEPVICEFVQKFPESLDNSFTAKEQLNSHSLSITTPSESYSEQKKLIKEKSLVFESLNQSEINNLVINKTPDYNPHLNIQSLEKSTSNFVEKELEGCTENLNSDKSTEPKVGFNQSLQLVTAISNNFELSDLKQKEVFEQISLKPKSFEIEAQSDKNLFIFSTFEPPASSGSEEKELEKQNLSVVEALKVSEEICEFGREKYPLDKKPSVDNQLTKKIDTSNSVKQRLESLETIQFVNESELKPQLEPCTFNPSPKDPNSLITQPLNPPKISAFENKEFLSQSPSVNLTAPNKNLINSSQSSLSEKCIGQEQGNTEFYDSIPNTLEFREEFVAEALNISDRITMMSQDTRDSDGENSDHELSSHDITIINSQESHKTENSRPEELSFNLDKHLIPEDSSSFDTYIQSMHTVLKSELNQSEAGPITADQELTRSEFFQDAANIDFEYLSSHGSKSSELPDHLTRQSLYVKFDPIVEKLVSCSVNMPNLPQVGSESQQPSPPINSKPEVQKTPPRNPAIDAVQKLISISPPSSKSDKTLSPASTPASSPRVSGTTQESPKTRGFIPQDVLDKELQKLQDVMTQREIVYEETLTKMESDKEDLKAESLKKDEVISDLQKKYEEAVEKEAKLRKEVHEKAKGKQQLSLIMEEYEKTISQLVAQKEEEKKDFEVQKQKLINERDSVMQHLNNSEMAFNDVHVKYERSKAVIEGLKKNEDMFKKSLSEYEGALKQINEKYDKLKNHAVQQLEKANQELDVMRRGHQAEIAKLKAMLKKAEISNNSLKESLEQKAKENQELTSICDELINHQVT